MFHIRVYQIVQIPFCKFDVKTKKMSCDGPGIAYFFCKIKPCILMCCVLLLKSSVVSKAICEGNSAPWYNKFIKAECCQLLALCNITKAERNLRYLITLTTFRCVFFQRMSFPYFSNRGKLPNFYFVKTLHRV